MIYILQCEYDVLEYASRFLLYLNSLIHGLRTEPYVILDSRGPIYKHSLRLQLASALQLRQVLTSWILLKMSFVRQLCNQLNSLMDLF